MTLAIAALLVSTLSTTGLLALWAATSRRHWFVRTAVFLAALWPLLFVPAYEVFVALALEGAVVAGGVWSWRWLSLKRRESPGEPAGARRPWRFSMGTLLLSMVLCGVGAAVASQAPRLNGQAWQSVVLVGGCGGAATLLGGFAATSAGARRWPGLIAALATAAALAAAPAWLDWVIYSFDDYPSWPPEPSNIGWLADDVSLIPAWFAILPAVVLCVFALTPIVRPAAAPAQRERLVRGRRVSLFSVAKGALLLALAAPAAWALLILLTPEPIPMVHLPVPNGYDDFVAAGKLSQELPAGVDVESANQSQLQAQIAASAAALARLRQGLARESLVPVDYSSAELVTNIMDLRSASRLLIADGRMAGVQGHTEQAVESFLETIELGAASARGGLMIDALVSKSIATTGAEQVYLIRDELDAAACRQAAERIWRALAELEDAEGVAARDRIWQQHNSGWHGRLLLGLTDLTEEYFLDMGPDAFFDALDRQVAVLRLTALELAARATFLETGKRPARLDEIHLGNGAPGDARVDPFSANGEHLRVLHEPEGVVFYSIGFNRLDDRGQTPVGEESPEDDLRLDVLFAPAPDATGTAAGEGGADASESGD